MKIKPYSINLSEQMAVCDANYIRILKLLDDDSASAIKEIVLPALGASINEKCEISVMLERIETFKYTSTIKIRQISNQNSSLQPEMLVRMYHDASTAEVISYQNHRNFKASYAMPNKKMYHADEKEQLNLFLSQWLHLCQKEGLYPKEKLSEEYLTCLESE